MRWLLLQVDRRFKRNELADEDSEDGAISENESKTRNDVPYAAPAYSTAPGDEKV